MKCIKWNSGNNDIICIHRVNDEKAKELVDSGGYKYISKKEWKEAGRPR